MTLKDSLSPSPSALGASLSPVGLSLRSAMPFEEWQALGSQLIGLERGVNWWLGDWLNFGAAKYGQKYTEALKATGKDYQTLMNLASVASRVEASRRRESLTWSHHAEVAALTPEEQLLALDDAERNSWSVRELREAIYRNVRGIPAQTERPYLPPSQVSELNHRIAEQIAAVVALAPSQRAFAEEVLGSATQQGAVSRLVNGKHRPNLATLERIAEWAGVPMSSFGVHDAPVLPVAPVQKAAQSALDAINRGDSDVAREILERLATALLPEDVSL